MKFLFTILAVCFCSYTFAQNKIVITYDQNGNRIKREWVCPGCRPAQQDSGQDDARIVENSTAQKTALENLATGRFKVFPNPTGNFVNLQLDALSLKENCRIILSDVSGKILFQKQITKALTHIPLNDLADGIYFLTLLRSNQKDVVRVVKEGGSGDAFK